MRVLTQKEIETNVHRAYILLDAKAVSDEQRVIEGVASTPTPDRAQDIVEPLGASFNLPMPLLWQHQHAMPVGNVTKVKLTKAGIPFSAQLAKTDEPGVLKDRLDEAWQSLKLNLVRAVSIGFRAVEYAFLESGGIHFQKWEWVELSLVTIPMQSEALITAIKTYDRADVLRAASSGGTKPLSPGVSGQAAPRIAHGVPLIRSKR